MFKKIFAKIGIGSASVDAVLTTDEFMPGGTLEGRIEIKGGNVEQEVSAINLQLNTLAKQEGEDTECNLTHTLEEYAICEAFTLNPGERHSLDFAFELHPETPVTVLDIPKNRCKVWLETSLDIDNAIDPKDRDSLHIHPGPVMAHFIDAMHQNGFKMVKADVEKGFLNGDGFASASGCYQELEFKPKGFGFSRVEEVELSFITDGGLTHVFIELDRRFGGDGYHSLTLSSNAAYGEVEAALKSVI
ncbi:MAG: sporulation protein [Desulfobacter sp.]|nr:MAG: sporulation protein [Desulfobacter sp.]